MKTETSELSAAKDKIREEFEKWGESQYEELWSVVCNRTKANLFDCYKDAWQASRKALVVELPVVESAEKRSKGIIEELRCYRDHNVKRALDAAGVAYK